MFGDRYRVQARHVRDLHAAARGRIEVDGVSAGTELLDQPERSVLDHLRGDRRPDRDDDVHRRAAAPQPRAELVVPGVLDDDLVRQGPEITGPAGGKAAPPVVGGELGPSEYHGDRMTGRRRSAGGRLAGSRHGSSVSFLVILSTRLRGPTALKAQTARSPGSVRASSAR